MSQSQSPAQPGPPRRAAIIAGAVTVVLIVLFVAITTGRLCFGKRLTLPAGVKVAVNERELSAADTVRFRELLSRSCSTSFNTRDRAEFNVRITHPSGRLENLACFSPLRILYPGNDIDAWTDDMADKSSAGYRISGELLRLIEQAAKATP